MPFNGSGTYIATSLPGSWNPAVTGQSATPADWNTLLADISTALTTTITKDGQTTIAADIPFATHKITGLGDPTAAQDAATKNYVDTAILPSGIILPYVGLTAPSGWILCNGLTIGNAASTATGRANADTATLFAIVWNSFADAQAPVLPGGRGGSAASDYSANKTIALPDLRGRIAAGLDTMGLASAARLSTVMTSTTPGAVGGAQTEQTTVNSVGTNSISFGSVPFVQTSGLVATASANVVGGGGTAVAQVNDSVNVGGHTDVAGNFGINVAGTTDPATNVQPTMVMSQIIKL